MAEQKEESIDDKVKRIANECIAIPKIRSGGGKKKPGNPKPLIDLFDKSYYNAMRAKRGKVYVASIGAFAKLCHPGVQKHIHEIDEIDQIDENGMKHIATTLLELHDRPIKDAIVIFNETVRYLLEKMAKTGELPKGLDLRATFPYQERQLILGYSPKKK